MAIDLMRGWFARQRKLDLHFGAHRQLRVARAGEAEFGDVFRLRVRRVCADLECYRKVSTDSYPAAAFRLRAG